jgi:hypothetical protein
MHLDSQISQDFEDFQKGGTLHSTEHHTHTHREREIRERPHQRKERGARAPGRGAC